jgi:hypothetical protein
MALPAHMEPGFTFPPFYPIRVHYPEEKINGIEQALNHTLDKVLPASGIQSKDRVAIGVGSRGITHIAKMVAALCLRLKAMGAHPVIIPAMGSHGGGKAAGQEDILKSFQISEETCGAQVISSLAVQQVGTAFSKAPVYFSRDALDCDHTICINRIKPHTKFKARFESGLLKMLCVGLGKHQGALSYHKWALKFGFAELLAQMAEVIMANTNFRFGIAIVENAFEQPLIIEAIVAHHIMQREPVLLKIAKDKFPRLPIPEADVLIIGEIGKDISGAGMDPNVTGRAYDLKESDFSKDFSTTRLALLNLSEKTKGNGVGLGNADFITEKLFARLNYEATLTNAMTAVSVRKAFIPVRLLSARAAITACFTTLGPVAAETVRAIMIKNTRCVSEFWASEALEPLLRQTKNVTVGEKINLAFDADGDLIRPML